MARTTEAKIKSKIISWCQPGSIKLQDIFVFLTVNSYTEYHSQQCYVS